VDDAEEPRQSRRTFRIRVNASVFWHMPETLDDQQERTAAVLLLDGSGTGATLLGGVSLLL
jgi:hypothetical protein